MKATLFAVAISTSILSIPVYATTASAKPSEAVQAKQLEKKININTATADVLMKSFKGIGKKRAEAIVSYRQAHGDFKSVAELSNVRGLSKTFVNRHLTELQSVFATQ